MYCRAVVVVSLIVSAVLARGQVLQSPLKSDSLAVSLAQKSVAALTGGFAVNDVTLTSNVISILGTDNETGTGTFAAKGMAESRVDLSLSKQTRSEARSTANPSGPLGAWSKNGSTPIAEAPHNTLTDASWFFPALSSLTQFGNPYFLFKYIGSEQHSGLNTQHIQIEQLPTISDQSIQQLSTMDFYLDVSSLLPVAVAYKTHPDNDMNTDIPVEILFANYQAVNRIQVPFHFQRMLNGGVVLDVIVTSVAIDSGVLDSVFTLQ